MRVLSTVALTNNQKSVLAKIVASPTPSVAGESISGDENMVAARNSLARLGAIESIGNEVNITAKGHQLAKDENITDETGQLTQDGNKLAYDDEDAEQPPEQQPAEQPAGQPPEQQLGVPDLTMSHTPALKGMSLLQELIKSSRKNEQSKWTANDDVTDYPSTSAPDVSSFKKFFNS